MLNGSIVALVTPMHPSTGSNLAELDLDVLASLVELHIASGTNTIVTTGSTGEAATLSPKERMLVLSTVLEVAANRIPVIAATGTNATHTTIELSKDAMALGANACLVVTPYYNRPTQRGLQQHFTAVAKNVAGPIIMYNVPGRTGCDLMPISVAKLAKIPNIIGIKEAVSDRQRIKDLSLFCDPGFSLLSGDDPSALACMLHGASGVISITANIAPKNMAAMCAAALAKNAALAGKINNKLMPLHKALVAITNPIPIKWAMQHQGLIQSGIRLPLTPLPKKFQEKIITALECAAISPVAS